MTAVRTTVRRSVLLKAPFEVKVVLLPRAQGTAFWSAASLAGVTGIAGLGGKLLADAWFPTHTWSDGAASPALEEHGFPGDQDLQAGSRAEVSSSSASNSDVDVVDDKSEAPGPSEHSQGLAFVSVDKEDDAAEAKADEEDTLSAEACGPIVQDQPTCMEPDVDTSVLTRALFEARCATDALTRVSGVQTNIRVDDDEDNDCTIADEALSELKSAVDSLDIFSCVAALAAARKAKVELCSALVLAQLIADPARLDTLQHIALVSAKAAMNRISSAAYASETLEAQGRSAEEFVDAVRGSLVLTSDEALRRHAAQLAATLADTERLLRDALSEEIPLAEQSLAERVVEPRSAAAQAQFEVELAELGMASQRALQDASTERRQLAACETRARLLAQGEIYRHAFQRAATRKLSELVAREAARIDELICQLDAHATSVAEAVSAPAATAHTSAALGAATLELRFALANGDVAPQAALDALARSGDSFVAQLVKATAGEGSRAAGINEATPARPLRALAEEYEHRVARPAAAVVLEPPGGGPIAALVGHLFASAWDLRPHAAIISRTSEATPADQLAVLSRAGGLMAAAATSPRGSFGPLLRTAMDELESDLSGPALQVATPWLRDLRRALLLEQLRRAVLARIRCLQAAQGTSQSKKTASPEETP
mmetsp:Transcript_144621/g.462352  ORF Transcript_144621/g.462352 Transcript_144621/m.462352 type:complete len:662 (-) Transcript_144621:440-2425(-)